MIFSKHEQKNSNCSFYLEARSYLSFAVLLPGDKHFRYYDFCLNKDARYCVECLQELLDRGKSSSNYDEIDGESMEIDSSAKAAIFPEIGTVCTSATWKKQDLSLTRTWNLEIKRSQISHALSFGLIVGHHTKQNCGHLSFSTIL